MNIRLKNSWIRNSRLVELVFVESDFHQPDEMVLPNKQSIEKDDLFVVRLLLSTPEISSVESMFITRRS